MAQRRPGPRHYVNTVKGKCGHVCGTWSRFLDLVICERCSNAALELDANAAPVWVEISKGEAVVKRTLKRPRAPRYPEQTIPLFDTDGDDSDKPLF